MRESFPFELILLTSPYMRCLRRRRNRAIRAVIPMKQRTPRMLPAIMLMRSFPLERAVRRFSFDIKPVRVPVRVPARECDVVDWVSKVDSGKTGCGSEGYALEADAVGKSGLEARALMHFDP